MGIKRSVKQLARATNLLHGLNQNFNFFESILIYLQIKLKLEVIRVFSTKRKIYVRKNTKDKETFLEIFRDQIYDTSLQIEPKHIIDAGANVGYFSLLFKIRYPNAEIVAIEIDKDNIECIKKNTKNLTGVSIIRKGLYNKKAFFKVEDPYNASNSFQVKQVSENEKCKIDSITIDEILESQNWNYIDILKIDIEGAEKNLFASNYENWLPKVKILFVETHDRMIPGCSKSVTSAMNNFDQFIMYTTTTGTLIYFNSELMQIA